MSKVKDLSDSLGFTVRRLASVTGYSRAMLYKVIEDGQAADRARLHAATLAIKREVEAEFQRDAKALQARYNARMTAAEEFLHAMMKEDAT